MYDQKFVLKMKNLSYFNDSIKLCIFFAVFYLKQKFILKAQFRLMNDFLPIQPYVRG